MAGLIGIGTQAGLIAPEKSKPKTKRKSLSSGDFTKVLAQQNSVDLAQNLETEALDHPPFLHEKVDSDIEKLLDNVCDWGEKLKKNPTLGRLKEYRLSISKIFSYILSQGFSTGFVKGVIDPKTLNQKMYTLVKVVDEQLNKLAQALLENQKDQLAILAKVDQITGLIVDLIR